MSDVFFNWPKLPPKMLPHAFVGIGFIGIFRTIQSLMKRYPNSDQKWHSYTFEIKGLPDGSRSPNLFDMIEPGKDITWLEIWKYGESRDSFPYYSDGKIFFTFAHIKKWKPFR